MLGRNFFRAVANLPKIGRTFATLPSEVVFFPDPEMVVCWHPEQTFPYECSKPLPEPKEEPYSALRIQANVAKSMFAKKRVGDAQTAMELAKITFTEKHRWFPRARDKRAKKTKPDRPYL